MWTSIPSQPVSFLDIIKVHSFFKCFTYWFVVQSLSHVQLFATLWTAACQASLSFAISQSSLKLMFIESVIPSNHLILLSSPSPSPNLSHHQGLFQWVGSLYQVAKVLGLQLQHQSFQWIFRIDFLWDWLVWSPAVQETLKSLLQHHSSKASILRLAPRLLYGPTLISIHDFWKNHSFDYMRLCQQNNVSTF